MLVEGHLVEWLILAKCVTLLKYCVNKIKIKNKKINHYDKQRRVLMVNSIVCQSK